MISRVRTLAIYRLKSLRRKFKKQSKTEAFYFSDH
jgi:hypothetical protein